MYTNFFGHFLLELDICLGVQGYFRSVDKAMDRRKRVIANEMPVRIQNMRMSVSRGLLKVPISKIHDLPRFSRTSLATTVPLAWNYWVVRWRCC